MRKNKFLAALAIAACLATSVPLSASASTVGQATDGTKVVYGKVSDADKAALLAVFDAAYYAKENADVVGASFTTTEQLFNHFITAGIFEGRSYDDKFNVSAYKSAYPDLQAAFGNDIVKYYMHWLTNGSKSPENRKATVEDVTKFADVYSFVDGTLVAKKQVAAASSSSSSSSSSSTTPSVTDASAKKIAELEQQIEDLKTQIANAKTDADKQAAEAAKAAAEKALEEFKAAQGDKSDVAATETEKYAPGSIAAGGAVLTDKSIPQVSMVYIQNGAEEAQLKRNVWYDYATGKFWTAKNLKGTYVPTDLEAKTTEGYWYLNADKTKSFALKSKAGDGAKIYKEYDLDKVGLAPYAVTVTGRLDPDVAPAYPATLDLDNDDDHWINTTDGAYIEYVSPEGERKLIVTSNADDIDIPGTFTKTGNVINLAGDYLTKNEIKWSLTTGFNKTYWVQNPEDNNWYVVVTEETTYHTNAKPNGYDAWVEAGWDENWVYKTDNLGNQLYLYHPVEFGDTTKDGKYFVTYNTKKDDIKITNSPYLRVDNNGKQYSVKYVAIDGTDVIDETHGDDRDDPAKGKWLALNAGEMKKHWVREWNEDSYSVTANSVTDGSYGNIHNMFVSDKTVVDTKEEALVNSWVLQYHFRANTGLAAAKERALLANDVDAFHADEYYWIEPKSDDTVLIPSTEDGFALVYMGLDGAGERVWHYARPVKGSQVYNGKVIIRAFAYTKDYKVACNQNEAQFGFVSAEGKYYVKNGDLISKAYPGVVTLGDGKTHVAADAEDTTDRWKQFAYAGPVGLGFIKQTNGTWAGETGIFVDKSRLAGLKRATLDEGYEDYVYVEVVNVLTYDEEAGVYVPDKTFEKNRWYKQFKPSDRDLDLLYVDGRYFFNTPEEETTGAKVVGGYYAMDDEFVEATVDTFADAFDLVSSDVGVFNIVQSKENGRFYKVRVAK